MFDRSDTLSTSARPIVWQTGKRFRQLCSVARIICVAVATLANEKLLERASDNDLLLCRSQLRIKRVIDIDLIDV